MTGLGRFLSLFLSRKMNDFRLYFDVDSAFLGPTSCYTLAVSLCFRFSHIYTGFCSWRTLEVRFLFLLFQYLGYWIQHLTVTLSHVNRRYQLLYCLFRRSRGLSCTFYDFIVPYHFFFLFPLDCCRTSKSDHVGSYHPIVHVAPRCPHFLSSLCTLVRTANL